MNLLLPGFNQATLLFPTSQQTPSTTVPLTGIKKLISDAADIWVDYDLTAIKATYTVKATGNETIIDVDMQDAKALTHGIGERFDKEYRGGLANRGVVFIKKSDIVAPVYMDRLTISGTTHYVQQAEDSDPLWKLFITRDQRASVY